MEDLPDDLLLERYREHRDEQAFARIVERTLPLVHSIAVRTTGRQDLAEDVSQQVFIKLARNPGQVRKKNGLLAWLHCSARTQAIDAVRADSRRMARERKAAPLMHPDSSNDVSWGSLAPHLDRIVGGLKPEDRTIVLLRHYQGYSLRKVAEALNISEEAARKRSFRALERLRAGFAQRGIATSSAVLATLLPAHAVTATPAAFAAATTTTALTSLTGVTSTASFLGLALMSTTTKIAIVSVATASLLGTAWFAFKRADSASRPDQAAVSGDSESRSRGKTDSGTTKASRPARESARSKSSRDPAQDASLLAELKSILSAKDADGAEETERKLADCLSRMDADGARRALDYITSLGGDYRDFRLRALDRLTDLNPRQALEWGRKIGPEYVEHALARWTGADADAALAWADAEGGSNPDGNPYYPAIIGGLPDTPDRLDRATALALALPEGKTAEQAIRSASDYALGQGVDKALQWLEPLSGDRYDMACTNMILQLMEEDPLATLHWMKDSRFFKERENNKHTIYQVLDAAISAGKGDQVAQFIENLPSEEERSRYQKEIDRLRASKELFSDMKEESSK